MSKNSNFKSNNNGNKKDNNDVDNNGDNNETLRRAVVCKNSANIWRKFPLSR